jgi:hypothetical protein
MQVQCTAAGPADEKNRPLRPQLHVLPAFPALGGGSTRSETHVGARK